MGARRDVDHLVLWLIVSILGSVGGCKVGVRPEPCVNPTSDGACFCPAGGSCAHACGPAVGHCLLGCSQGNRSCGVTCGDDCVALCTGAGQCDAHCGERCNVSCEGIKERCTAVVGPSSNVRCDGATDCLVDCTGSCNVNCTRGRCRVRCPLHEECDLDCGGAATQAGGGPLSCPDGTRVCGQPC